MKINWFKHCDFFKIPTSLCYKREYYYATNVGAFLTIICFLFIVSLASYEIRSLYEKSSFTIISNQYTDLSQKLDFSQTPIMFQLANDNGELIESDEKLFEFKAYDIQLIITKNNIQGRNYTIINKKLELDKCDKVFTNHSEYFENLNLSRYVCIKKGQNITSYGLIGDTINGFKGFRIYINRCSGKPNCYNNSIIENKLQNSKFIVTYLSLKANIYDLDKDNLKYQIVSKSCSISTNMLKKIYYSFSIGRFLLYNSIVFRKKNEFNYIIQQGHFMDTDLDSKSTMDGNLYTLAYISFHYSGNILEICKEVRRLFDTISIIGNSFNIILTLFKIINNYYSNKVLFVDIFKSTFFPKEYVFAKENNKLNFAKESNKLNLNYNFNTNKSNIKKNYMDNSNDFCINNYYSNKNIELKKSSKKSILVSDKSSNMKKKKIYKLYVGNQENSIKNKIIYFYLIPLCYLRKKKSYNNVYLIKDKICGYFSIEKIHELIKFKTTFDEKAKKTKINNTELIQINDNYVAYNSSNKINNKKLYIK